MQEILSNNIQNKIILITGATSGIGYALSKVYLNNNWTVIGIGRDQTKVEKFINKFPHNFFFYKVDLNNFQNTNNVLDEIFSKYKNINSFILNAGIYIPESYQDFKFINAQETFNVNVLSVYLIIEKIKFFF
ncbi:SDR family oxidoreductase [Alphaproteobacteria bacterium]|nr:SDR family oxidoreductase [Alphaproteobacteria bacterium]